MLPFFTEHFGNASSRNHPFGWKAGKAVEQAREQVGRSSALGFATSSSQAARPNRTTSPSRGRRGAHRLRAGTIRHRLHGAPRGPRPMPRAGARRISRHLSRSRSRGADRSGPAARCRPERHAARQRDVGEQRNRCPASGCRDRGDRARAGRAVSLRCRAVRRRLFRLDVKELGSTSFR